MELKKVKTFFLESLKKDKLVKLIFILGICGIALIYLSTWLGSGEKKEEKAENTDSLSEGYEQGLEADLRRIVRAITGEEAPEVMVTLENSGKYVYAADGKRKTQGSAGGESKGQGGEESETAHIILKDADGAQHALTVTEIQPKIKGVVIVSRFAGDPVIREKLTDAVRTALDVSSAKVCVTDSG